MLWAQEGRGCSTGVLLTDLLIPGRFPVSGELSLAVDLSRVAEPDPGNAEFLLAVWDPLPVFQDGKF